MKATSKYIKGDKSAAALGFSSRLSPLSLYCNFLFFSLACFCFSFYEKLTLLLGVVEAPNYDCKLIMTFN
ncbi:hypothetical protein RchiOBHm_Chr2g0141831 [Rosa chinensis]|uniref:Uncharacterized protein n=1 Tax=Rosa chinensis TaxID=74649 RepID=A0A2P6RXN6_ROSCH|nr:hypothetical protein RchiOBHm_Chr2g0141831 [Rosa chinensis]